MQLPNRIANAIYTKFEEVEKCLLNSAGSANKHTPVASAITTKKLSAPRRLASLRLPNRVPSHQKARKIEVPYECRR
jgi:hypothetical protein